MHKYEELTPYEFDQEKERASIIYVAAGPLEYHEECNILGLDTNKGYDWCLAAAEITGGICFPCNRSVDHIAESAKQICDIERKRCRVKEE